MAPECIILERGAPGYEESRRRFINSAVPDRYPYQIVHPRSSEEVAATVKHAVSLGKHISVRSGGHLFPFQHLQEDEILIDMKNVNASFDYDEETGLVNFGPGLTVKEAEQFLTPRKLFFPFGHAPTVGLGGFILVGGQGVFMPGWGVTADRWITQLEIVTADGEIRLCNRDENADLFWAARGAGMGFFGVLTKLWARTVVAKKLYVLKWVFKAAIYVDALNWILDSAKLIRPHHTEVMIRSYYADKGTAAAEGRDEIQSHEVVIDVTINIYADSLEEAREMSYPFDKSPLEPYQKEELHEADWDELFGTTVLQPNNRLKCDSILSNPEVSRKEFLDRIRAVMVDLPSRRSTGFIYPCETFAPGNLAYSLPSDYYVASYLVWSDAKDDVKMKSWLTKTFTEAKKVSLGTYVADFDADQRMTKESPQNAFADY